MKGTDIHNNRLSFDRMSAKKTLRLTSQIFSLKFDLKQAPNDYNMSK